MLCLCPTRAQARAKVLCENSKIRCAQKRLSEY